MEQNQDFLKSAYYTAELPYGRRGFFFSSGYQLYSEWKKQETDRFVLFLSVQIG